MRKILECCPTCQGRIEVTELHCPSCETTVRGRYEGCTFCQLSPEDIRFVALFVASRGNVKEMERETGLGYWTIRGRLGEVIDRLGLGAAAPPPDRQRDVLEAVARGELTAADAERWLAEGGSGSREG
ncbi:MAG: DUF2089 domain-containing protein [Ardenticatenales bacterium]|nr:DUF2089 domain-containing protein [Ardenticatenales bacterium]